MDAHTGPSEAKALTHRDARLVILGVLLPLFMGSIDSTILASALPTIGRDVGDVRGLPWLITIYFMAETAAMPLYAKFADTNARQFNFRILIAAHTADPPVSPPAPSIAALRLVSAM